jgi:DNA-binding transcriptional ArsR family regulator
MKLNDRYIKATLAGIPYLLPYGQLIAAPAPATRLNDSGALLLDGILEGDSREELRLAVMSILLGVEEADFVFIREQTGASAGNLSVQIDKLQKAGYITVEKTFRGKMPRTLCRITPTGVDAFEEYVEALKSYIKK